MKYDVSKCERARLRNGWTRSVLAKRSRLSKAVVSNFLNGRPVRIDSAKRIADALGVEFEQVVKGRVA